MFNNCEKFSNGPSFLPTMLSKPPPAIRSPFTNIRQPLHSIRHSTSSSPSFTNIPRPSTLVPPSFRGVSSPSSVHSSFANMPSSRSQVCSSTNISPPQQLIHASVTSMPPPLLTRMPSLTNVSSSQMRQSFIKMPSASQSIRSPIRNISSASPLLQPSFLNIPPPPLPSQPLPFPVNKPPPSHYGSIPPASIINYASTRAMIPSSSRKKALFSPESITHSPKFMKNNNCVPNLRSHEVVENISSTTGKYHKKKSVKSPALKSFSCDGCTRSFISKSVLDNHVAQHVVCKVDGCKFVAIPSVMIEHTAALHPDLKNIITDKVELESVLQWRENRKKKYPIVCEKTVKNVTSEIKRDVIIQDTSRQYSNIESIVQDTSIEDATKSMPVTKVNECIVPLKSEVSNKTNNHNKMSKQTDSLKVTNNNEVMTIHKLSNDNVAECDVKQQNDNCTDGNQKLDSMVYEDDLGEHTLYEGDIERVKRNIDRMMSELDNSSYDSLIDDNNLSISKNKIRKRKRRSNKRVDLTKSADNGNVVISNESENLSNEHVHRNPDDDADEIDSDIELNLILAGNDKIDSYICPIDGSVKRRMKPTYLLNKIFGVNTRDDCDRLLQCIRYIVNNGYFDDSLNNST